MTIAPVFFKRTLSDVVISVGIVEEELGLFGEFSAFVKIIK